MTIRSTSKSAQIRSRLKHPVIDADGHSVEITPVLIDYVLNYVRKNGGTRMAERLVAPGEPTYHQRVRVPWSRLSPPQRRDEWLTCPVWLFPNLTARDRATASLPRLLAERMDEMGLDFTVLYPTTGMSVISYADDETRPVVCRALNSFYAEYYREFSDRMTPAAIIPMNTPQEAIAETEHVVKALGLKVITIGHVMRPVPRIAREHPELARFAMRLDTLGIDSDYDYDPLWARCVELKAVPTSHAGGHGWGSRRSISNYMYNHIGSFASAGEALCKSLFLGGVTRRFPTLKFAFLEGGVGWATSLYADLISHWQKRNPSAFRETNEVEFASLVAQYGNMAVRAKLQEMGGGALLEALYTYSKDNPNYGPVDPGIADDWARCGIERAEDVRDLFVPRFYFGCEADDPANSLAFNTRLNPFGARLGAMLSSDIGHWDTPDLTTIVSEAYELVERDLMTEQDFRDFVFTNPATLWAGVNPDFFKGTRVAADVDRLLPH